ncbi:MAG: sugar phosphate isomerase/epimerase [Candidatus Heimdallarchaeota archaeon]|nr:sugar phosphate isomerase/epimerase [Candidatus Heimdallarchaeota archaeon]
MGEISFSTGGLYPRLSFDALGLIENAGYDIAEFMPQCTYETTPAFAKEVEKLNVTVDSIHYPLVFFGILYNPYPGMVKEAKVFNNNLVNMGSEMGTRVIVIHPVGTGSTIDPAILENLLYLCDISDKAGIKIVLENHPKGGRTAEELTEAAKMIGHKNLELMLDVTESWECDVDPVDFVNKLDLAHLHLSDFSERGKHLPPGEGDVKWKEFFAALKRKNYSGSYVVEPIWRYYTENALEKLIEGRKFIESCL